MKVHASPCHRGQLVPAAEGYTECVKRSVHREGSWWTIHPWVLGAGRICLGR